MTQLNLPLEFPTFYYPGLELKTKKGHSSKFCGLGRKVNKFVIGMYKERGYFRVYERSDSRGSFFWLLTDKELDKYFEPYNKQGFRTPSSCDSRATEIKVG